VVGGGYDRLVGSAAYNRFVWRSSAAVYTAYAAAAVADGPLLDLGCGTALFTAEVYRDCGRPVMVVDRSPGMLARAAERLGDADPERVALVQANLFDLPFRPGTFTTTVSYGLLHLFDDLAPLLRVLDAQRTSDGTLRATSLVPETALAGSVLRLLHLAGETARPRRLVDLATPHATDEVRPRGSAGLSCLQERGSSRAEKGQRDHSYSVAAAVGVRGLLHQRAVEDQAVALVAVGLQAGITTPVPTATEPPQQTRSRVDRSAVTRQQTPTFLAA
jgi:SAM-dependent methyltransferase